MRSVDFQLYEDLEIEQGKIALLLSFLFLLCFLKILKIHSVFSFTLHLFHRNLQISIYWFLTLSSHIFLNLPLLT
jgi:hypothetical protein